jgi:hypothetical protein
MTIPGPRREMLFVRHPTLSVAAVATKVGGFEIATQFKLCASSRPHLQRRMHHGYGLQHFTYACRGTTTLHLSKGCLRLKITSERCKYWTADTVGGLPK